MSLDLLPEVTNRPLKTLFCGVDGTGKSTGAKLYCDSRDLHPVCIDFDDTNHTGVRRLNLESWKVNKKTRDGMVKVFTPESVIDGIIQTIREVEKSHTFDTLIIDGVGTLNNLLLPEGKESQRTYLIRTQNFKRIWRVLLESTIHIIFIGQKDLIVDEEKDSSKFAEMINNMINYRFNCYHTGNGFTSDDFTYVCTKTRGEIEPLIGKPLNDSVHSQEVTEDNEVQVFNKEYRHEDAPQLITDCIDSLTSRGVKNITSERVLVCIRDRCSDEDEYNTCKQWLDENLSFDGGMQ